MTNQPLWSVKRWWPSVRRLVARVTKKPISPLHSKRKDQLILSFAMLTALVAFLVIYADEFVARWFRAYGQEHPQFRAVFALITEVGESGWALIASAALGLFIAGLHWGKKGYHSLRKHLWWYSAANFAFFSIVVSGTLISLIKNTIGRARPKGLDTLGPHYFDFAAFEADFASFPSGHSTTFGAMAMVGALLFPTLRWLFVVLGAVGGFSRIAVGAHYTSDVIAGLAFGAILTWVTAVYLANRRVLFKRSNGWLPLPSR